MPFSQKNPFNAEANFTSIKFGVNKPVLEVELNEMQHILRNHSKDSIKELFGDGVVGKGQYTYTSNKFTLANEVAILDGEVIKVDSISITANNGDSIYLQSYIEEKSYVDQIKKYGNSTSATTVTNAIKDSRVNMETSRREQLVYKLATTVDNAKKNLKLGTIKNGTFVLDCPVLNQNIVNETVEGSYITVENTKDGAITDIEILGNTVQSSSNLADIKSVGIAREDGNFEIELKSYGKNLLNRLKSNEVHRLNYQSDLTLTDTGFKVSSTKTGDVVGFITKCKPNTTYTVSFNDESNIKGAKYFRSFTNFPTDTHSGYNETKNGTNVSSFTLTTTSDCRYLFLGIYVVVGEEQVLSNIQIEEGTVATTYEPYQETTSKIILPCQLEKVGTVSDRLFRREDGVWCIEKNTKRFNLSQVTKWDIHSVLTGSSTTHIAFSSSPLNGDFSNYSDGKRDNLICSVGLNKSVNQMHPSVAGEQPSQIEGVAINSTGTIFVKILKTKASNVTEFKNFIDSHYIIYQIPMEIIELPLDVQVSLNSFFGTTNVFIESGEVDGTIKCTVAKSLGGSIKSLVSKANSIEERVEKIENLQKGNNMQISTDKSYVVVEDTNEGYITDFKIEGNTIKNLMTAYKEETSLEYYYPTSHPNVADISLMKPNTTYTLIYKARYKSEGESGCLVIDMSPGNIITTEQSLSTTYKEYVYTFDTPSSVNAFVMRSNGNYFYIKECVLIEGDYSKTPQYFDGLLSMGQDVEIMKIHSKSKNLLTEDIVNLINGNTTQRICLGKAKRGVTYTFSYNCTNDINSYTDLRMQLATSTIPNLTASGEIEGAVNFLGITSSSSVRNVLTITSTIDGYLYLRAVVKGALYPFCYDIQLTTDGDTQFYPYEPQIKQLLYQNSEGEFVPIPALRGINDSVRDTIELHSDGKYYYHKRCEEVVLNGEEVYNPSGLNSSLTDLMVFIHKPQIPPYIESTTANMSNLICDKFSTLTPLGTASIPSITKEGVSCNITYSELRFAIAKTKLTSQDVTGFKTWLQQNPTTVVYQLATEEVYECNNLDLNSYEGETLVQIESGAISPSKLSFKHSTHIGNIVTKMKEDVDKNTKFREEMTESVTYVRDFTTTHDVFEDTKEGRVAIERIEGRTLVNLCNYPSSTAVGNSNPTKTIGSASIQGMASNVGSMVCDFPLDIPTQGKITLSFSINATATVTNLMLGHNAYTNIDSYDIPKSGYVKICVDFKDTVDKLWIGHTSSTAFNTGNTLSISNMVILQGDHTDKSLYFFEGLKSVGNLDNLYIHSRKNDGNLFNQDDFIRYTQKYDSSCKLVSDEGTLALEFNNVATNDKPIMLGYFEPNTQYTFQLNAKNTVGSHVFLRVRYTDGLMETLGSTSNTTTYGTIKGTSAVNKTISYMYISYGSKGGCRVSLDDFIITKGLSISNYEKPQGSTKTVLVKNSEGVYEKPILRSTGTVKDTIELHSDGKYYYHKRCKEIVINGESSIAYEKWESFIRFTYTLNDAKTVGEVISDRFNSGEGDIIGADYIRLGSNIVYFYSKDTSKTTEQFKTELKANPVTLVYQLAMEEVYECVNLDLDSYEGETSIIFPSTIPATIKASVGSNLIKTIQNMKDRINYLENKVMNMFKSVLSGDVQSLAYMLYPEDFKEEDHPTTLEEPPIVDEVVEGIMPLALGVEEEKPKKKATRTKKKVTKKSE